jgi:hypothetical protein
MKTAFLLTLFLAAAVAAGTAGAASPPGSESTSPVASVTGSGRVIDDERALSAFVALRVAGPIDVRLKAATHERVIVRADDNIAPLIQTRVVPGDRPALEVDMQPRTSTRPSRTPTVIVEFRTLQDVTMRGSGDLHADRIETNTFALSMTGSGDARIDALKVAQFAASLTGSGDLAVAGSADEQGYQLTGSGDVSASRLRGRRVIVLSTGSGDAVVHATESLQASLHGSGDITYLGSPRVVEQRNGTGRLRRRQ